MGADCLAGTRSARDLTTTNTVTDLSHACRKLMNADATLPTVTPPRYGADATGFICGYLLESGPDIGPIGRPIDCDEAARWLAEAGHAGFVWLHFNLAHTGALPWLRQHAELSDAFFEALYDGLHSTRIERSEEALIAVVNDLLANRLDHKRARLGALRRLLVRLQRLLAPEPAALFRLLQHPPAWWPSSMCRNCGRRARSFRSRCAT